MSPKGLSLPVFLKGGNCVNSDFYIEKCLPKVKQFINKFHQGDNVIFWPDLASAHYSRKSQNVMKKMKIPFLDKQLNPPCAPRIRPIEDFWAIIKRRVYSDGFIAKSHEILIRRIRKILREVEKCLFKKLMEKVPRMVRKAARRGLESFNK